MSRPKKPLTLIQRAIDGRNVEEIYWAFIALSAEELRNEGKLITFSGNHLVSFLADLSKMSDGKKQISEDNAEELKLWISSASK